MKSSGPGTLVTMDRQDRSDPDLRPLDQDTDQIAGRLDRLTAEQADEVMRRAISLHDEDAAVLESGSFDVDTLRAVAAELGIPRQHLERALAEQRAGVLQPRPSAGPIDRMLGVADLEQSAIVNGRRAEVERATMIWLSKHEGLRVVRRSEDGATWEKDTRPLTSIRVGLGLTQGSKALRDVGTVEHSVRSVAHDEQVVTIKTDPEKLRAVAGALLVLVAVVALTGGAAVAAGTGSVLAGFGTAAVAVLGLGAAVLGGIRSWARRIRRAGERAIDAVRRPEASGLNEPMSGWLGTVLRGLGLSPGHGPGDH